MQEVGGDHVGDKRCGLFLEHHRHDVISYVAFPLELKEIVMLLSCYSVTCRVFVVVVMSHLVRSGSARQLCHMFTSHVTSSHAVTCVVFSQARSCFM